MKKATWKVDLTPDAERDFADILRWTWREFGRQQAQAYRITLRKALEALESGPNTIGAKKRDDLAPGIHTLHVARNGRKGRHFIVFRIAADPQTIDQTIDVLRLLHDSMDLNAHLAD